MSRLKDFTSSRIAILTAMFLARHLPRAAAQHIANVFARMVILTRGRMYGAICDNQAQVTGMSKEDPQLNEAVRGVIVHAGQTYYDLFRYAAGLPTTPISFSPDTWANLMAALDSRRGVIAVGAHISNFDLGMQYLTSHEIPIQVLSLAEPPAGFQLMNRLRTNPLCEVTPISTNALRAAIRRLQAGGLVVTAVDRPVPDQSELIEFFGRPAPLPTGHIRLALRTDALVLVLWCEWLPDQGYIIRSAPPLKMERTHDLETDIRHNARRVLQILETAIATHPDQWLMFVPVWPTIA